MELMPTYVSYNFLEELKNYKIDLLNFETIQLDKGVQETIQLLYKNAIINFDKTEEETKKLLEDCNCNPILKAIWLSSGQKRIVCKKEDFNCVNVSNFNAIEKSVFTQFYLDKEAIKNEFDTIEKQNGHLINSFDRVDTLKRNSCFEFKVFDNVEKVDWSFIKTYNIPSNSMVIVDPYLLVVKDTNHIISLIKSLYNQNIKENFFVTFFFNPYYIYDDAENKPQKVENPEMRMLFYEKRKKLLQKEIKKISESIILEIVVYDNYIKDFHDRYVLTNNFLITTSNSFGWVKQMEGNERKHSNWLIANYAKIIDKTSGESKTFYSSFIKFKEVLKSWIEQKDKKYSSEIIKNPILR